MDGTPANRIAHWDGQTWATLGDGLEGSPNGNASVSAIAIDAAGRVYVGGDFSNAGGVPANGMAMWDGSSWHSLDGGLTDHPINGVSGSVNAIAIDPTGAVFVGGNFSYAGDVPAYDVARWDGRQWNALSEGIAGADSANSGVFALAADLQGNLYAAGTFVKAGQVKANNIAKWDGKRWSSLNGGITGGYLTMVKSLLVDGNAVIAGGWFTSAGNLPVNSLAKWDGNQWNNINAGDWVGINVANEEKIVDVLGLARDSDGYWIAAGDFIIAGGKSANGVALWDGKSWSGLGKDDTVDGPVNALIPDTNGGVFMGGGFFSINGKVVNRLAHWDGTAWNAVGGGMPGSSEYTRVLALALDKNGYLYAAGGFYQVGKTYAGNIAKWDGQNWRALGSGTDPAVEISSIAVDSKGIVYAAGQFGVIGGVEVQSIARWNGTKWEAMGSGLDGAVYSMVVDAQDRLVVCGDFRKTSDLEVDRLARWNGIAWERLNNDGISPWPTSLMMDGDTLYLGGEQIWSYQNGVFKTVGAETTRFKGGTVMAMAMDNLGRLVVAGDFTQIGDTPAAHIARWNGSAWETLGSGTDQANTALAVDKDGTIWVAGNFTVAGGHPANGFASWMDRVFIRNWHPAKAR